MKLSDNLSYFLPARCHLLQSIDQQLFLLNELMFLTKDNRGTLKHRKKHAINAE